MIDELSIAVLANTLHWNLAISEEEPSLYDHSLVFMVC